MGMDRKFGWPKWLGAVLNADGPWGSGKGSGGKNDGGSGDGSGGGSDGGSGGGPRNPWGNPGDGGPPRRKGGASIEDIFKKRPGGRGGGGRGGIPSLPQRPGGKSWWPLIVLGVVLLWLVFTSIHRVSPQERGVVSLLGSYSRTLQPGLHLSFPAPVENVEKLNVEDIRTEDIPAGNTENLILTGDQNIVDLGYSVRWNIKNPELFLFQIAEPEETIREVAESAMRAVVANFTLDDAIGAERTEIEQRVTRVMQELLDGYRAGVTIQGIAIKKADPPEAVNDAFKAVSAAQQEAQTYLNEARAYAQQLTAQAQGEAAAFDKVYEEYRLAPEVTRRRMYYETMERVLSNVDKTIVEPGGVTPYIALPEVRKRSSQGTTVTAPGEQ